jgi:hypothetical protein
VFTYSILEGMDVDPANTGLVQVTQLASYVANGCRNFLSRSLASAKSRRCGWWARTLPSQESGGADQER